MIGIERLHIIFDASGSFCEPGKKHMLNYLGNTAMNLSFMSWARVEFVFYTWNDELCEVEDVATIPTEGIADTNVLCNFLSKLTDNEAVILITDGNFENTDKKKLKKVANWLGKRFAVVAAGYDAAKVQLQSLSNNFFYAEDMYTAFKILAG